MDERPPSPTNTEWNTFQVMANPDFVNIHVPKPTFQKPSTLQLAQAEPLPEESPPPSPKEVQEDIGDSISVVAEKVAKFGHFAQTLEPLVEEDEATPKSSPKASPKSQQKPASPVQFEPPSPKESLVEPKKNVSPASSPPASPKAVPDEDLSFRTKVREMTESEILSEKEGLLSEISLMEKQGIIKLYRELTIADSLEEIQFQQDRAMSNQNALTTVDMAKTGIKFMSQMMEVVFNKMGLKLLDGFSNHLCKDMNRFNRPLTKMQRKYWRGSSLSPETELAIIVFGSVLVTIMHNNGFGFVANMFSGMTGTSSAPSTVPPMARPEKPAPPQAKQETAPASNSAPSVPAIPVMRRPKPVDEREEPRAKTVTLDAKKPAKKRPEAPPLEL